MILPPPSFRMTRPLHYRITEIIYKHLKVRIDPFAFAFPPIDQLTFENGKWINIYIDRIECLEPGPSPLNVPSDIISLSDPNLLSKIMKWNEL